MLELSRMEVRKLGAGWVGRMHLGGVRNFIGKTVISFGAMGAAGGGVIFTFFLGVGVGVGDVY